MASTSRRSNCNGNGNKCPTNSTSTSSSATSRRDGDVNQKRRRRLRTTLQVRRLWKRWSLRNPVLANLLVIFVCLCLLCMMAEQLGGGGVSDGSSYGTGGVRQRMRRAKALLQRTQHHGDSNNNNHGNSKDDDSGSGDDKESELRARPGNRGRRHSQNKHHGRHTMGWKNRFKALVQGEEHQQGQDDDTDDDEQQSKMDRGHPKRYKTKEAQAVLDQMNQDIVHNRNGGIRWVAPYLMLPPLANSNNNHIQDNNNQDNNNQEMTRGRHRADAVNPKQVDVKSEFFKVKRKHDPSMAWEGEYDRLNDNEASLHPPVDYVTHAYHYPELLWEVPDLQNSNKKHKHNEYPEYPPLQPLGDLMKAWPQDEDFPGAHQRPIPEGLLHFNYSDPKELDLARLFRDAELPFKLYNIPEVSKATKTWTDEYVSGNFDGARGLFRAGRNNNHHNHGNGNLLERIFGRNTNDADNTSKDKYSTPPARASGMSQESPNNFFAFFQPQLWDVRSMGLPPVRTNDWTYEHWSRHARYADAVGLDATKPHFYYQSGVPREERHQPTSQWTFISRDLPSFSSPTQTFFVFEPESQKGIQCRFGERGVVAATHYDSGRNMIAMVTGAKRYILAPPKECASLGIVPWKFNSEFRHSLLNFGHIKYMNDPEQSTTEGDGGDGSGSSNNNNKGKDNQQWTGEHMSDVEREWMKVSASSQAIETVLKAGEVLYIPSHWFHYIVSLQKSAQCNVRSGVQDEGTPAFGGKVDVKTCGRLSREEALD